MTRATFAPGDLVRAPYACGGSHKGETGKVSDVDRFPGLVLVSFGAYSEPFKPYELERLRNHGE